MKILFRCFAKQATLLRRSTVLSLPPQLVLPAYMEVKRTDPFLSVRNPCLNEMEMKCCEYSN
jgi:hypothetical protein